MDEVKLSEAYGVSSPEENRDLYERWAATNFETGSTIYSLAARIDPICLRSSVLP